MVPSSFPSIGVVSLVDGGRGDLAGRALLRRKTMGPPELGRLNPTLKNFSSSWRIAYPNLVLRRNRDVNGPWAAERPLPIGEPTGASQTWV